MEMLTQSSPKISTLTADDVAELASRLETDNYSNAFEGLQDWHLLRAIAFQRPELVEPYLHLLDLEAFDEA
jgi:type IV secretory pathway ATPase VirB11/archaellum biosynthesis ATPase